MTGETRINFIIGISCIKLIFRIANVIGIKYKLLYTFDYTREMGQWAVY